MLQEQQKNFELAKENSNLQVKLAKMNEESIFTNKKLENQKRDNIRLKNEVEESQVINKNLTKEIRFASKKVKKLNSENQNISELLMTFESGSQPDIKTSTLR